jgi:hypothetical protein
MTKINDLLLNLPAHVAITTRWLEEFGISRQLLAKYVASGWFEYIAKGVVKRRGDKIPLLGSVYALQKQLSLPLHIGARSALALHGKAHYIRFGETDTFLMREESSINLPSWFKKADYGKVILKTCPIDQSKLRLIPEVLVDYDSGGYRVKIASPELAIVEACYMIPNYQGFEECYNITDSLRTLRPSAMQNLLEGCNSIKAKRLFLFMAFKADLPVTKHLDLSKINLGKGKLQVALGGVFDSRFLITIPPTLKGNEEEGYGNTSELLF